MPPAPEISLTPPVFLQHAHQRREILALLEQHGHKALLVLCEPILTVGNLTHLADGLRKHLRKGSLVRSQRVHLFLQDGNLILRHQSLGP
jgi:hypothetical protein